jgi:cold shock CspA family protein
MSADRKHGEIDYWDNRRNFGWINCDNGRRIFFAGPSIRRDWKGSEGWAFDPGISVTFEIGQSEKGAYHAEDVAPSFPLSEPEDVASYRENSRVAVWNGHFGWCLRPCGAQLFFHKSRVDPDFESRLSSLAVGTWISHRVGCKDEKWFADDIEIFGPEDLEQIQEPEPEPVSLLILESVVVEHKSELLSSENYRRTLLEIIQSRKNLCLSKL